MAALSMTFACGLYDRMLSLATGEVKPAGIDLNFIPDRQPARAVRPHGWQA
jgi:4,5-dihydroxyphthalate decarboxylase